MSFAYKSGHFIPKPGRTAVRSHLPVIQIGYDIRRQNYQFAEPRRRIPELFINRILERHFNNLADDVVRQTQYLSSPLAIKRAASFQKIVQLGDFSTKRILQKLKRGDIRLVWLLALRAITKENPVPDFSKGIVREMARYWLQWGQQRGLV